MTPPVENLLLRTIEIEECFHRASIPSCKVREGSRKGKNPFGAATLNCTSVEALLDIGKLNRINVGCHHRVMGGEFHRGATGRGNAEDTSARLKGTKLNFGVLIHASE
jgi:hypothetical protein